MLLFLPTCYPLFQSLQFKHLEEMSLARAKLVDKYGLGDNIDVLFGFADKLYAQYRWADCYAVTSRYAMPFD